MRDLHRWKDKVELTLDGRQVFFLFFGGAVVACLLFVSGILVGKRMEARALAMTPPHEADPLAALDQLGDVDPADEALTYHKTLSGKQPPRVEPPAPAPRPVERPAPAVAAPVAPRPVGDRYTLQLSAFADKADADDFMRKVQALGFKPFVVASEVPGRGTFYRVRVGDYASRQAATDAKGDIEKKQHLPAYVARL
jgi:cell division septation protein DedD